MKNCKSFHEAQAASCLKEIIQPFPQSPTHPHQIKSYYVLGKKNFMELYRNIQTFAFKVLQKYSSLVSRNGATQMFFLTPNRNMFAGKFVKSERFLTVLREYIMFHIK